MEIRIEPYETALTHLLAVLASDDIADRAIVFYRDVSTALPLGSYAVVRVEVHRFDSVPVDDNAAVSYALPPVPVPA